jgi:hypothetical protein
LNDGLAVPAPRIAITALEADAIALYESRKKPITLERLKDLQSQGKQEPSVTPAAPLTAAEITEQTKIVDAELRSHGFTGRQRVHRNRE